MELRKIKLFLSLIINIVSFPLLAKDQPNIILVLSDDHSFPHVGIYGEENCKKLKLTPNLDSFTNEGIRFTKAYTSSPQCSPSRSSIFSGQNPISLGVTRFGFPTASHVEYFTDVLRENGYWVGLEGRGHHLDGTVRDLPHIAEFYNTSGLKNLENRFDYVGKFKTKEEGFSQISKKLNKTFDLIPEDKPFFLYFGFSQPHRRFSKDYEGIDPTKLKLPPDWPDFNDLRIDYAQFLNEVRDLDVGFGILETILKERSLKENTIVIFMGDNGESLLRGKGTLYDRGTHVPLMIRWPNHIKPGTVSHNLICGIDLAPTILEIASLKTPASMSGLSFYHQLKGKSGNIREYVFAERGWHDGAIYNSDGLDLSRSVTTKNYRLIYNALPMRRYIPVDMVNTKAWRTMEEAYNNGEFSKQIKELYYRSPRPIFELFDLTQDPYELNNLSGRKEYKEVEERLRLELDKWMLRQRDYLPLPSDIAAAKRYKLSKGFVKTK